MSRLSQTYFVYLMTNRSQKTLYTGVTNDLQRRVYEHRNRLIPGFSARYNVDRLLYYEPYYYVEDAIAREKEIKGWVRRKKVALIESINPGWEDLSTHILEDVNEAILRFAQDDI